MKSLIKIVSFFLCLSILAAQGQQKKLDSLHAAINTAKNDTIRMLSLDKLSTFYSESNRDSALYFSIQGLQISRQFDQPLWVANFLMINSYIEAKKGNLPEGYKLANQALLIAQNEANEKNVFIPPGDKFANKPHQFRLSMLADAYQILGVEMIDDNKSIMYYKEEIRISQQIGAEDKLVNSNGNIGRILLHQAKFDSALIYSLRAVHYAKTTGERKYEGLIFIIIGTIYLKQNQIDSAGYYYQRSVLANQQENNMQSLASSYISLANLYQAKNQADSSLYYGKEALLLSYRLKSAVAMKSSTLAVSEAYKMLRNSDSAYAYLNISKKLSDSLNVDYQEKLIQFQNINFAEQQRLEKEAQKNKDAKTKTTTIALVSGMVLLSVLAFVFFKNNKQKQKTNKVLQYTLTDLKSTQTQLIQSEKMASLGELTAGIAHEIQNPLNFVNNFSEVSSELADELKEAVINGEKEEAIAIADNLKENVNKINHHGKRADGIVKGMLQHSRSSSGKKELTDINGLADEYLRLSYHGLRAKDKTFNASIETHYDESIGKINIIPQDIGRVILNLFTNAFYSVSEKKKLLKDGYTPIVSVTTRKVNNALQIIVRDNGNGIPQKFMDKIYQPFFTTKPSGEGTGLGLSMSYDIITKTHNGTLEAITEEGKYAEFKITLPYQ